VRKIEAIIRQHKLETVKDALSDLGIQGMTVIEVRGFGRQKGHTAVYRGAEYSIDLIPKIKIEIVVAETRSAEVIQTIVDAAKTGEVGDGKIFVTDLSQVVRIRTGELDHDAI